MTNYLQAAANRGQNFSNATGGFKNAAGASLPTKRSGWAAAGGATAQMGSQPTSAPFILTVTATSVISTATTFTLFFANGTLNGGAGQFSAGSWYPLGTSGSPTSGGITVSSAIANTSYQQLLVQSQLKPFVIGKTMLIATGTNYIAQITNPINFSETYADGRQAFLPLIFVYDQYQQITSQTTNVMQYTIDGNAGLQFTQQPTGGATSTTTIYLYPLLSIDTTGALNGQAVVNQYGAPAYSGN